MLSQLSPSPHLYLSPYPTKTIKKGKHSEQFVRFCLFMKTLPISFALRSGNGNILNYIKIKRQKNIDRYGPRTIPVPTFAIAYPPPPPALITDYTVKTNVKHKFTLLQYVLLQNVNYSYCGGEEGGSRGGAGLPPPTPPPWSKFFSSHHKRVLCTECFAGNREIRKKMPNVQTAIEVRGRNSRRRENYSRGSSTKILPTEGVPPVWCRSLYPSQIQYLFNLLC
jgi:hypothetical protein